MTPRRDVDIRRTIAESTHSRLPVVGGETDDALVQAKEILDVYLRGGAPDIRCHVRQAPIILDTADALDVVDLMKRSPIHIAPVHNEYGHFSAEMVDQMGLRNQAAAKEISWGCERSSRRSEGGAKCSIWHARETAYGSPIEWDYMVSLLRIYGMIDRTPAPAGTERHIELKQITDAFSLFRSQLCSISVLSCRERLRHATQCLMSRMAVIQTDRLPRERMPFRELTEVICGGPNTWESIRQQFELPRAIPSGLYVGLGRCNCCVDCKSGAKIDLIDGSSADLELGKTITLLHICPRSSSCFASAACRPRPGRWLSSHSAPQRVFRRPPLSRFSRDRPLVCELLRPLKQVAVGDLGCWRPRVHGTYPLRGSGHQRTKTPTTSARRRTPSSQCAAHRRSIPESSISSSYCSDSAAAGRVINHPLRPIYGGHDEHARTPDYRRPF